MEIKNIIVHEADKLKSETAGDYHMQQDLRELENPINEHSINLVEQVSKLFRNTGLSSGGFKEPIDKNDEKSSFERLLESNFINDEFPNFVDFTRAATRNFSKLLKVKANAKGGYLWFNHYVHNNKSFLSIVLLRKKDALRIKDLSLDPIEEIDLEKLHMAARINISDWKDPNPLKNRYISFRIGRGSGSVTDYFSDFIGCQEYTLAKEDTSNLISATVDYCNLHKLDAINTERAKDEVHDKCRNWLDGDKPVYLESISELLDKTFSKNDDDSGRFLIIAQGEPYLLNNEIKIDRKTLGNLVRYRGNNSKMSISFDSSLLGETVKFDKKTGYLEFRELPNKLLAQLSQGIPIDDKSSNDNLVKDE